jgi:hypothetical protein
LSRFYAFGIAGFRSRCFTFGVVSFNLSRADPLFKVACEGA